MGSREVPWWDVKLVGDEGQRVQEVLDSGFLNDGPRCQQLESQIVDFVETKHAIVTPSGTTALSLALMAMGIGPGDTVAVPAMTFVATAHAVLVLGSQIVLVDVDPVTGIMDANRLEDVIRDVDAIVVTHVSGRDHLSSDLATLAQEHGVPIVEDAAEAFGSWGLSSVHLGTSGAFGAFSFSPNKVLTAGQGGCVVTSRDDFASIARTIKDQGRPVRGTGGDDVHFKVGYNFKWTDIQAVLVIAQFKEIQQRLSHLSQTYSVYAEALDSHSRIDLVNAGVGPKTSVLWPEIRCEDRELLCEVLDEHNIGYRRMWNSLSKQPSLLDRGFECPGAERIAREGLWLPSSLKMTQDDRERVANLLANF